MINSNHIFNYLQSNKDRLFADYHLTKIGLFGSIARGEQNDSSDIDLLVEFQSGTSNLHILKLQLKNEIQTKFGKHVDLCRIKYIKPVFRDQILSEARYVK